MKKIMLILLLLSSMAPLPTLAEQKNYTPAKVVYDLTSSNILEIKNILDRASLLQKIYDNDPFESSIVIVIHGKAIPRFARDSKSGNSEIIDRAQGLATGEVIQFRLCSASAKIQGYGKKDFSGFITMVPMADAEIVKLQHKGYAYLH